jgi:hypothetical protein
MIKQYQKVHTIEQQLNSHNGPVIIFYNKNHEVLASAFYINRSLSVIHLANNNPSKKYPLSKQFTSIEQAKDWIETIPINTIIPVDYSKKFFSENCIVEGRELPPNATFSIQINEDATHSPVFYGTRTIPICYIQYINDPSFFFYTPYHKINKKYSSCTSLKQAVTKVLKFHGLKITNWISNNNTEEKYVRNIQFNSQEDQTLYNLRADLDSEHAAVSRFRNSISSRPTEPNVMHRLSVDPQYDFNRQFLQPIQPTIRFVNSPIATTWSHRQFQSIRNNPNHHCPVCEREEQERRDRTHLESYHTRPQFFINTRDINFLPILPTA